MEFGRHNDASTWKGMNRPGEGLTKQNLASDLCGYSSQRHGDDSVGRTLVIALAHLDRWI